jgi:nucleotidyltransferase substrate binding protein (TIGR01987 family)
VSGVEDDSLAIRLGDLESALARLRDALAQPKTEWTRDAAIQRFEFTFELAWKSVAIAARREGVEVASPRRAWQAAYQLGWVDDDRIWLDMLEDRNRASHSYREATAEKILARLGAYVSVLGGLLDALKRIR